MALEALQASSHLVGLLQYGDIIAAFGQEYARGQSSQSAPYDDNLTFHDGYLPLTKCRLWGLWLVFTAIAYMSSSSS